MSFTLDPRLPPGVLTVATGDPALTGQTRYPSIVDSGADAILISPDLGAALFHPASMPMMLILGIHQQSPTDLTSNASDAPWRRNMRCYVGHRLPNHHTESDARDRSLTS